MHIINNLSIANTSSHSRETSKSRDKAAKMCGYTYSYYICGCDYYIHYDSVEFCEHRSFSGYSVDGWSSDMCDQKNVVCEGISNYYCSECSEDHTLEYALE